MIGRIRLTYSNRDLVTADYFFKNRYYEEAAIYYES